MGVLAAVLVLATAVPAIGADETPLEDLKENGKGETDLGTWALEALARRNAFPFFEEKMDMTSGGAGRWFTPSETAACFTVKEEGIGVRVSGYQNNEKLDKWVPALVFTAKAAGKFALGGALTGLWFDGDKSAKDVIQWAVIRITPEEKEGKEEKGFKVRVLTSQKAMNGDVVEFEKQEKLQAIELKDGESLGILLWRPSHWNAVGGTMKGITVEEAEAPASAPATGLGSFVAPDGNDADLGTSDKPFATLAAARAAEPVAIPDDKYVTVSPDGHLQCQGKRVRYWGFIGSPFNPGQVDQNLTGEAREKAIAKARADIDLAVDRIHDLGFNLIRHWYDTSQSNYKAGDGSPSDLIAYFFYKLDQKGIRIWNAMVGHVGTFNASDVNVIDDPATADAWKAGVNEWAKGGGGLRVFGTARAWDPRISALAVKRMENNAKFPNHYKNGLRLADDPQVAVWELTNEEWYHGRIFGGSWQELPAFFRNGLLTKWNEFLKAKYGGDDRLKTAWGFLLPGESLDKGSIMLAPLGSPASARLAINDTNPDVIARLSAAKQQYTRDDFTRRRGEDVVEFTTQLWIEYKSREAKALKTWGKSTRLSPLLWDTGNTFQIQAGYMFQFSDAVAACTYIKGMGHDPTHKRWPFYSGLDVPPRMCRDVPWVEQARQKGKPFFVYETQIDCRTKYRAEYPMRIAAIGAIQDWDIVNWHTFDAGIDSSKPNPFDGMIHVWHDYLGFGHDEVQLSAMKACAEVFKNGLLAPAPKPTTFIFGRKTLYDPASTTYGKSYGEAADQFIPTCYRYGAQVVIDPTREDDAIEGPSYRQGVHEPCPVKPNDQIEYDWSKGHLKFDSPGVIGYVGFYGERKGPVEFSSGARFTDVTVLNPEGIAYPVTPEEGYVEITVASQDGQPLAKASRAIVSAVSTSFNTGFGLDLTKSTQGRHQDGPANVPPQIFRGAWAETGKAPVLVARVGVTIRCKDIDGMKYTLRDWHMRDIGQGTVKDGVLTVPADKPIFIIELAR